MGSDSVSGRKKFLSTRVGKLVIGVGVFFALAIIGAIAAPRNDNSNAPQAATNTSTQTNAAAGEAEKTPQQILEERLTTTVKNTGTTDVTYGSLKIERSDPDRPTDTQMITVNANVSSFYNKNALLRDTGKLSSSIFQVVYGIPNIKAYDVFVNYKGEVTDKYGNKTKDTILVYDIDKSTYQKIDWQNFDQTALCNFLKNESNVNDLNTACNVLVNIQ